MPEINILNLNQLYAMQEYAETALERSFKSMADDDTPPELKEFNIAVTALRRLIDARRALWLLHNVEQSTPAESPDEVIAQIQNALDREEND